jgi:[ribosomal protein S5]-alanine N-acetyltransferase
MLVVPELTDGVISLRTPERGDIEPIFTACQDPAIVRFTRVPFPYTRVHAQAFVRNAAHELRAGNGAHLVVADGRTNALLGVTGLTLDRGRRSAEVGYWVAPQHRRQGVAHRAVRCIVGWALRDLGIARVQLMADVRNEPSQRVAELCGFRREGVLRSYEDRLGERIDYVMFSVLPGELT